LATGRPKRNNAKLSQKESIRGDVAYFLKFWYPLYISGTVKAGNFKFGTQILATAGPNKKCKIRSKGAWRGHVTYF